MNEEQRKFYMVEFGKREELFFQMFPEGKVLKERLLKIGGNRVAWRPENPISLIEKGIAYSLDNAKLIKGEVRGCHRNTARLYMKNDIHIITGFALNKDVWIEHSWGFNISIIETTTIFNGYYGVMLNGLDITKFVFAELGEEVMNFSREQLSKLPMPENINE